MAEGAIQVGVSVCDREIRLARERRSERAVRHFGGRISGGIGLEAQRCRGSQRAKRGGQFAPSDVHAITSSRWWALLLSKRSTWISAGSVARSARLRSG